MKKIRRIILLIAFLNLGYFGIEFFYAFVAGSVSLMADSIDFLEDGFVSLLIFFATAFSLLWRRRVGIFLSIMMVIPSFAALWAVWQSLTYQSPPSGEIITTIGFGALIINIVCTLLLLTSQKKKPSNLIRAAYLSNRNDAITNIIVMATGLFIIYFPSIWPDVIVGIFIAILHASGALEVYKKSQK